MMTALCYVMINVWPECSRLPPVIGRLSCLSSLSSREFLTRDAAGTALQTTHPFKHS